MTQDRQIEDIHKTDIIRYRTSQNSVYRWTLATGNVYGHVTLSSIYSLCKGLEIDPLKLIHHTYTGFQLEAVMFSVIQYIISPVVYIYKSKWNECRMCSQDRYYIQCIVMHNIDL